MRKGSETFVGGGEKKTEQESKMRDLQKATHNASPPPQSVGPLASSNCVSLSGAAMVKSV